MPPVVIENPIINSPFAAPERHYRFDEGGITSEIVSARRPSSYFVPIAQPRSRTSGQQTIEDWTGDRIEENPTVNQIRTRVRQWVTGRYTLDTTPVTARLLDHWTNPGRGRPLFYCQIEALQTLIYITEVAKKVGDQWIENHLLDVSSNANPGLFRVATKMATGSGKTVVMAMLIAWQSINKARNPQDARFTDAFLLVTPGITIRDRLRVLLPADPANYYKALDIVPSDLQDDLGRAKVVVTNYHAFRRREKFRASKLTKDLLSKEGEPSPALVESVGEMVNRVCRELGRNKQIIVINDEAHHCYRRKPDEDAKPDKLTGDERQEAEERNKAAHQWLTGLAAIQEKIGIKTVFDLSATPFFLRGSGYSEGTLFPWVVSDFSLIDAIESGIVKVPRVPVADDALTGTMPTYRDLWVRIRDELPRKGRGTQQITEEPRLPKELEGALLSLYGNYEKRFKSWQSDRAAGHNTLATPPVFIVVCNNTNVSKMVFDWISGYEKTLPGVDGTESPAVVVPGKLDVFSNVERGHDGTNVFRHRPNTILVDSEQLESGDTMSADFKAIAARELDEFKHEYRLRYPGADADALTDEDLLREVLNTVGKPGKLGEHIRCVVSVSMLTEGWDANTVTHVLGVRAFGTQLLCEQVVGRGLRRMSYRARPHTINVNGQDITFDAFPVEYTEVYGVPFSFIPSNGQVKEPRPGPPPTRVRALADRAHLELSFPRVDGYRYELADAPLRADFGEDAKLPLTTRDVPSRVEVAPIVGEREYHTLDEVRSVRPREVAFRLAHRVLSEYISANGGDPQPWRFPEVLGICEQWLAGSLILKDNTFPQLLLFTELQHKAAAKIYKAIVRGDKGTRRLLPLMNPYDPVGSTRAVDFDTTRPTYATQADKCHISHVVADTDTWEQKAAQSLEDMVEVLCYAKNHNLHFTIPYTYHGEPARYIPDFLVWINDGRGANDPLKLILEISGHKEGSGDIGDKKAAKVSTARDLWVPAVNGTGQHGRWAFLEGADPWDLQSLIRKKLPELTALAIAQQSLAPTPTR
ncbi:MAG: restriction endonuclease [Phycisphaerae bacterium]|nr:MAG: restriction endonuclease [Phycisphaerae bacterium]